MSATRRLVGSVSGTSPFFAASVGCTKAMPPPVPKPKRGTTSVPSLSRTICPTSGASEASDVFGRTASFAKPAVSVQVQMSLLRLSAM